MKMMKNENDEKLNKQAEEEISKVGDKMMAEIDVDKITNEILNKISIIDEGIE